MQAWAYAEQLNDYLQPEMWSRFASLFPACPYNFSCKAFMSSPTLRCTTLA